MYKFRASVQQRHVQKLLQIWKDRDPFLKEQKSNTPMAELMTMGRKRAKAGVEE